MSAINFMKCDAEWIGSVRNQPAEMCGLGVLDRYLRIHVSALESVRKSTCYFSGAITTALGVVAGPAVATGDIAFAVQAPQLFVNGVGQVGTAEGIWATLTRKHTNCDAAGDLGGSRDIAFMGVGIMCAALNPFQRQTATGTSAAVATTDVPYYPAFLRADGPYQAQIKSAIIDSVTLSVVWGNTGTTQQLGGVEMYPAPTGGLSGGSATKNGAIDRAFDFTPLPIAVLMSSSSFPQKAVFTASLSEAFIVGNVAAVPTQITNAGGTALTVSTVFAPLAVYIVGHMVCYPYELICGMPTISAEVFSGSNNAPQLAAAQYPR